MKNKSVVLLKKVSTLFMIGILSFNIIGCGAQNNNQEIQEPTEEINDNAEINSNDNSNNISDINEQTNDDNQVDETDLSNNESIYYDGYTYISTGEKALITCGTMDAEVDGIGIQFAGYDRISVESDDGFIYYEKQTFPNIKIEVVEETISQNGADFIITNISDSETFYGQMYRIEKLVKDEFSGREWNVWITLTPNEDTAFTQEAYTLESEESVKLTVNWEWIYNSLEPGIYRLYKYDSVMENGELKSYPYYAEFNVL